MATHTWGGCTSRREGRSATASGRGVSAGLGKCSAPGSSLNLFPEDITPPHHHVPLTHLPTCLPACLPPQTATDTQKNTVYVVAKRMAKRCSIEQYAVALAQHFVHTYPRVSRKWGARRVEEEKVGGGGGERGEWSGLEGAPGKGARHCMCWVLSVGSLTKCQSSIRRRVLPALLKPYAGCSCCCPCCLLRDCPPPPHTQVSKAKVWVEQAPWKRVTINGISHEHGERGVGAGQEVFLTCRPDTAAELLIAA